MSYFKMPFIFLLLLSSFINQGHSQSKPHRKSIISTRMVVLTYKHNDSSAMQDHTDTLNLPVVSDKYPELKKALAFENIGDSDGLDSVRKNYAGCGCGLTSLNYDVTFESGNIISLKIYTGTEAAYPSSYTNFYNFTIPTGKVYSISNEVNSTGLKWIYNSYRQLLKKRIKQDYASRKRSGEDADTYKELNASIDSLAADALLKNYLFTAKGIIFTSDGVLPHVIQALEPDRNWFIPYEKLKPYKSAHALVLK